MANEETPTTDYKGQLARMTRMYMEKVCNLKMEIFNLKSENEGLKRLLFGRARSIGSDSIRLKEYQNYFASFEEFLRKEGYDTGEVFGAFHRNMPKPKIRLPKRLRPNNK